MLLLFYLPVVAPSRNRFPSNGIGLSTLVYVPSNWFGIRLDLSANSVCATLHNNDGYLDIIGGAARGDRAALNNVERRCAYAAATGSVGSRESGLESYFSPP